ncbi:MAG: hypothetical protein M3220_08410, partial [Chloroflexota bacterium]|nr:hypothetical protein [Chloroflexota bacterium]
HGYVRMLLFALLVALGLETGFFITPVGLLSPVAPLLTGQLINPMSLLLWLLAATGATWLGLVYLRFFSGRVLASHLGSSPPKWTRRLLTLAVSLLLGVLYVPLLAARFLVIYDLPARDTEMLQSGIMISSVLALSLYLVAFGGTWLLLQLRRPRRSVPCPTCRQPNQPRHDLNQSCEHCGHPLARWLYEDSSTSVSSVEKQEATLPIADEPLVGVTGIALQRR